MLKSCSACGRIHDSKYICTQKQKAINDRQRRYKSNRDIDKFRNTKAWRVKRDEIRDRDKNLCQICIRNLCGTINQYTYNNLSVHHVESLEQAWEKRLDDDNLITTCDHHHEKMESGEIPVEVVKEIIREQEGKICQVQ
jgi:5-methylcytosine-specific restriction endonuclease McrA